MINSRALISVARMVVLVLTVAAVSTLTINGALAQEIRIDAPDTSAEAQSITGTTASEMLLPAETAAFISVPNAKALQEAIKKTQFGAMTDDPSVKPFIDDLIKQIRSGLDKQNIRFGVKLSDIEQVHSGEICFAGILERPVAGVEAEPEHAIVLLVNVAGNEDETNDLLARVAKRLLDREATEKKIQIGDVQASKWSFKKPEGLRKRQFAFHAVVDGWLVASDNESKFQQIIGRFDKNQKGPTNLASSPAFQTITRKCNFEAEHFVSHIRWFVEPFRYVQLGQAIAEAQDPDAALTDNFAQKLEEEGFSAIKGLGGSISFATGEHETAHRTFVFAPPVPAAGANRYLRAAAMLDFSNAEGSPLNPPSWVPEGAAGFASIKWDLEKAMNSIGPILDKVSGREGSFERVKDNLITDPKGPKVDLDKMAASLDNQLVISSITKTPVDEESERLVFGVRVIRNGKEFADSVERLAVGEGAVVVPYKDSKILVIDSTDEVELPEDWSEDLDDEFGDDAIGGSEEDDDEPKPAKPLFEKRVIVVHGGFLLYGNNVEQIKSIIDGMPNSPGDRLALAGDYQRVNEALIKLAGDQAPSMRHFTRLDKAIRTNYEMLRTNRMVQSKTLLAQLLNRAYTTDDSPEDFEREQEIDGSKLPENFEGQVAKYFGPAGMIVHTQEEGWLITGVVLQRSDDDRGQAKVRHARKTK